MVSPALGQSASLPQTLQSIPDDDPDYGTWWGSPEGRHLYDAIIELVGHPAVVAANRHYGVAYEATDVANTAFTILRNRLVRQAIQASNDPWAYLAKILRREICRAAGTYYRHELTEQIVSDFADAARTSHAVTIYEAVDLTVECLGELSPHIGRGTLREAVLYFAERGHQRISHLFTAATVDAELTGRGLSRPEILAIANAVLGSRPDHGTNSIIAGYLADPTFEPGSSIPHRRALQKFQRRMTPLATRHESELLVG